MTLATGVGTAVGAVSAMEFLRADLGGSGGIMLGLGAGDWITVFAAVIGAVWALHLMKPEHYPEILEIWERKWRKERNNGV